MRIGISIGLVLLFLGCVPYLIINQIYLGNAIEEEKQLQLLRYEQLTEMTTLTSNTQKELSFVRRDLDEIRESLCHFGKQGTAFVWRDSFYR